MHLPLRPIFPPVAPGILSTYAPRTPQKIWAQPDKNLLAKSSTKDSESSLCPSCPLTFTHWHAYLHPLNLRCIFLPFGRFCTIVYTTPPHKYIHLMLHYIANNAIICTQVFPALALRPIFRKNQVQKNSESTLMSTGGFP